MILHAFQDLQLSALGFGAMTLDCLSPARLKDLVAEVSMTHRSAAPSSASIRV